MVQYSHTGKLARVKHILWKVNYLNYSFNTVCIGVPSDRGVIFNCFQHIFDHIAKSKNQQYLVRASYMEIYKVCIFRLLRELPFFRKKYEIY